MTSEQRCGTCRWADWMFSPGQINCIAPRPISDRYQSRLLMSAFEGEHCPCYQPAPQPQTETEDDGN